ncbi:group IIE secretory phospholipase A2-like [Mauremys mutica]|uniref:group IIE secretory phospholipase A2-like n=1 Tax=Mauremys mutica TaxID=74926 RepID=UPI001D163CFC|nr:group IIE secretory phospholipase A2-like [Mauremys mutica]
MEQPYNQPQLVLGSLHSLIIPTSLVAVLPLACSDLIQFAKMIKQMTGKDPLLNYNAYGCYCGLGGSKQPLDATDWCCHAHDCCYRRMQARGCKPKTESYPCSIRPGNIACNGGTVCQKQICECDKAAALCFKRAAGTYNKKYRYYLNLRCKGTSPRC